MFKSFFLNEKWLPWSIGGTLLILLATWYKVHLDVQINEWFGTFYDAIQKILSKPNSVTFPQFLAHLMLFAKIAGIYIALAVLIDFFWATLHFPLARSHDRLLCRALGQSAPH